MALGYAADQRRFRYHTMVVPVDSTVVLAVSASDVFHSWWIRKLGAKIDGVPGHVNETFKIPADQAGATLSGQCAELCGAGHADVRAKERAVTPEEFESWDEDQRAAIRRADEDLAARRGRREGEAGQ